MATFAKTPKGHRVRVERETIGTANERGKIFFGQDGPLISGWVLSGSGFRTMEFALQHADERIEAMGLIGSEEEPRELTLRFRVTESERDQLHSAAESEGVTLSQYIRSKIL